MNPAWLRALILVCIFSAVVLAAEALVRALANARAGERAINERLTMIGRGATRAETVSILRRATSSLPEGLPAPIDGDRRQVRTDVDARRRSGYRPARLMLFIFLAPLVIFFGLLLLMSLWWGVGISFGRILISAVFAGAAGRGAAIDGDRT